MLPDFEQLYSLNTIDSKHSAPLKGTLNSLVAKKAERRAGLADFEDGNRLVAVTEDETLELFRFFADAEHACHDPDENMLVRAVARDRARF